MPSPVIPLHSDASPRILCPRSQPRSTRSHIRRNLASVHSVGFRTTPSSAGPRARIHSSCAPHAPFSFQHSSFPCTLLSSIDMSCAPRSPGLLVRLHFVSMFSVLPFRNLRVSDLYIAWLAVCLEMETLPSRSSTPTLCAINFFGPSTLTLSHRSASITSKIENLHPPRRLFQPSSFHHVGFPFQG